MNSSSGGIFTLLGEAVIDEGGVVFGARFDENWEVVHGYTETKKGLEVFRGSKYVQSRIGNTYKQVKKFLKKGQQVLFSGTPCQIAGLKKFLKKEGICIIDHYEDLSREQAAYIDNYYHSEVYPVLTPMAVDSSRPFPLIRNKSLNIGALIRAKKDTEEKHKQGYLY